MTVSRASAAFISLALAWSPALAQDDAISQEEVGAPLNILPTPPDSSQALGGDAVESEVETVAASPIGAEAYGTLGDDDGGLGTGLWAGSRRAMMEAMVARLGPVPGSPVAADLARRLLLTAAPPPDGPGATHWLALRLDRLGALGGAVGDVPGAFADAEVARAARRVQFQARVARGDEQAACADAEIAVKDDDHSLWPRAAIYCQLRQGRADAALLGLDVLEASGAPLPASFVPLARGLAAGAAPDSVDLAGASVVEAAMAGALGIAPAGATDPWALAALGRAGTTPDAQRLAAAEQAAGLGALSAVGLADIYDAVVFDAASLAAPVEAAASLDGPAARALLHQAAGAAIVPEARAEAIAAALATAAEGTEALVTARVFGARVAELIASEPLVWFAPVAARALIADERPAAALAWWRLAADRDAVVAAAMEPLWPLARLAELDAGEGGAERMALWWQRTVVATDDGAARRAALAAALMLALGDGAGAGILAETAATRAAAAPAPALQAALEAAALEGRVGETVTLALVGLADGGLPGAPADAIVGAVRALSLVGLEDEARRLAIEAAIVHGL